MSLTKEERRVLLAIGGCVDWIICERNGRANGVVQELRSAIYDLDPPDPEEEEEEE